MRAGLLALPSRVAQRLPHLTRGDKAAIEDEIRAILEELAEAGPEAGSGGAEAAPAATSEPWIEANLTLPEGTSGRLFLVGVDTIKTTIINRFTRRQFIRFAAWR